MILHVSRLARNMGNPLMRTRNVTITWFLAPVSGMTLPDLVLVVRPEIPSTNGKPPRKGNRRSHSGEVHKEGLGLEMVPGQVSEKHRRWPMEKRPVWELRSEGNVLILAEWVWKDHGENRGGHNTEPRIILEAFTTVEYMWESLGSPP